jgi:inhibitor of cysteine peptidase
MGWPLIGGHWSEVSGLIPRILASSRYLAFRFLLGPAQITGSNLWRLRMQILLLIGIFFAVLLCACGSEPSEVKSTEQPDGAEPASANTPHRLAEGDTGRSIELRVGDTLEVSLPGNPTTGFEWEVAKMDPAILRSRGEPEFVPSSSALGSGGIQTIRFETVGTGQMKLTLIYHRPFEKDTPPARTFEVTITVR